MAQVQPIPGRRQLFMGTPKSLLWYTRGEYKLMIQHRDRIVTLLREGIWQAAEAARIYLETNHLQDQPKDSSETAFSTADMEPTCTTTSLHDMICLQGLEGTYGNGKTERDRLRRQNMAVVLLEQELQHQDGYFCDDLIADSCKEFGETAQELAVERATRLAFEVGNGNRTSRTL